jgi:hypothetical protein
MPEPRRLRPWRGAVYGVGAGAAAGAAWVLMAGLTKSQLTYLAVGVGIAVGVAVGNGARLGGRKTAVISVAITVVAVAFGLYYTQRVAFIRDEAAAGRRLEIPLLPSWAWFHTVLRGAFDRGITMYLTTLISLAAAASYGFRGPVVHRRYVHQRHMPRRPR